MFEKIMWFFGFAQCSECGDWGRHWHNVGLVSDDHFYMCDPCARFEASMDDYMDTPGFHGEGEEDGLEYYEREGEYWEDEADRIEV